ncbi:MAG: hypothetical protein QGG40_00855, partial [Myxococcota bacterium]|nr:hypothetical protein [Myxococcota bacterium]
SWTLYDDDLMFDAEHADMDGDGAQDLLLGSSYLSSDDSVAYEGALHLFTGIGAQQGDLDADDATASIWGAEQYQYFGYRSAIGDLDGDGYRDIVGIDDGSVYLFEGPFDDDLTTDDASVVASTGSGTVYYKDLTSGDLDGDGLDDLVLGDGYANGYAGEVYVLYGPSDDWEGDESNVGYLDLGPVSAVADARIEGDEVYTYLGQMMESAGDLGGDGVDDLVLATPYSSENVSYGGALYVFSGPVTGSLDLSDADAVVYGSEASGYLGVDMGAGGDVDGDGYGDLVASAPGTTTYRAFLFAGEDLDQSGTEEDLYTVEFEGETYGFGYSVDLGTDLDADGLSEVLVGDPYATSDSDSQAGRLLVFYGAESLSGDLDGGNAELIISGTAEYGYFGSTSYALGDVDGDGAGDLAAYEYDYANSEYGLHLFLGGSY